MTMKAFLKLVEIQTKTASMLPLLFGSALAYYRYGQFKTVPFLFMALSLLLFDMTTTTLNNFMDFKKSTQDSYRREHNIIGKANLSLTLVRTILLTLLALAVITGLVLVSVTGPVVLVIGALSFCTGILYTFGPIPISRMPLGEMVSGFFMGFVIIYLSVYVHNPELARLTLDGGRIILDVSLGETLALFLVSLPFTLAISNLMLANNICDLEQDVKNDRFLLPYYLGKKNSLILFKASYYGSFLSLAASVALGILPLLSLLSFLVLIPVQRNIMVFDGKQVKEETFVMAVKNLIIISLAWILPLAVSLFFI